MSEKYLDEIVTMEEKLDGFKTINSNQKSQIFDLSREQSDLTAEVENLRDEIERNEAASVCFNVFRLYKRENK